MDKIIHYEISIEATARENKRGAYEFYSYDKNTAKLTFTLPNPLIDISVTALFYFTRSKAKWETIGTVENNKVTVEFDTTLITQNEDVIGYLYFKTSRQQADVFQFRFSVKLSRIDRKIAYKVHRSEVPQINLSDYVTKLELDKRLKKIEKGGEEYDDTGVLRRLEELEKRESNSYDDSNLYKKMSEIKDEVNKKADLTEVGRLINESVERELTSYAAKSDVDRLKEDIVKLPKEKLGMNLLLNSGNKVTNNQYPTTYFKFKTVPDYGKKYTLTIKVEAPTSKTGVVVQVRNNISLGALPKVGEGIYSLTFEWKPRPQEKPYELVIYQTPNNNIEASVVWAKFVEGVDTDYYWYPNYDEISSIYTFEKESSKAIETSNNLLEGTFAEKQSGNEFLNYSNIAQVIDVYGIGKYTLSFDLKAKMSGNVSVYISGTGKYKFLQKTIAVTTEYQRYIIHIDITKNDVLTNSAFLSFFGGKYGNGIVPTVKRLRLSKGTYTELPWKPSEKELTKLYEKILS